MGDILGIFGSAAGFFSGLLAIIFTLVILAGSLYAAGAVVYHGVQFLVWLHGLGPPQIPIPAVCVKRQAELFPRDKKPNRKKAAVEEDELLEEVLGDAGLIGVDHIYLEDAPPLVTL